MGKQPSHSPRAITWALVAVALPLLYLLSVPPVWYLDLKTHKPRAGTLYLGSRWTLIYAMPYMHLRNNTPLKGPLNAYLDWWSRRFFPGPPPKK